MAIRAWPAGPQKKHGAGQDSEPAGPRVLGPYRSAACAGRPASPHKIFLKKNLHLCILITSFMDSCINISNSCITGKDKYYVIFDVLKFKEYIVYVIVWIWWKCWIINVSSIYHLIPQSLYLILWTS